MTTLKQRLFFRAIPIFIGMIGLITVWNELYGQYEPTCKPIHDDIHLSDYFLKRFTTKNAKTNINLTSTYRSKNGYDQYIHNTNYWLHVISGRSFIFEVEPDGEYNRDPLSIWIDWDNNGTFTDNELVYSDNGTVHIHTGVITFPDHNIQINRDYLMRATMVSYASKTLEPCAETNAYAHTIDFNIRAYRVEECESTPGPITLSHSHEGELCIHGKDTLNANVAGGIWKVKNIDIATINEHDVLTGWDSGQTDVVYTVVNPDGCADSSSTSVTVKGQQVIINGDRKVCQNGTIQLISNVPNGTWESKNEALATVDDFGIVTGLSEGDVWIYYNTIQDECKISGAAIVTVKKGGDAGTISGEKYLCLGSETTLTATKTGGTWKSSNEEIATVENGIVKALKAGTTTISYTISSGIEGECDGIATHQITIKDIEKAFFSLSTNQLCIESSINAVAQETGGTWATTDQTIATIDENGQITSVALGTVGIIYTQTSENGCTSSDTVQLKVVDQFEVGTLSEDEEICNGDQSLTLSSSNYGGQWTTTENESVATIDVDGKVQPTSAGQATFTYTIPKMGKCEAVSAPKSITVLESPEVPTITGSNTICEGSTLQLTASAENGEWKSDNKNAVTIDTEGKITGIKAGGSANITVSVGDLCKTSSEPFAVTVTGTPSAGTIQGLANVCLGSQGVTYTVKDASTEGTWSVSDTAVATVNATTGQLSPKTAGTVTLTYTIEAPRCEDPATTESKAATLEITITDGQTAPTFDESLFATRCENTDKVALPTTSTNNITGVWTPAEIDNSKVGTSDYTFAVETQEGGCTLSVTKSVTVNAMVAAPTFDEALFDARCVGSDVITLPTVSENGIEGTWNPQTIETTTAGDVEVTFTANQSACVTETTVQKTVTINALPEVKLVASADIICLGSQDTLTASGATTYSWNNEIAGTEAQQIVSPSEKTEYVVTGTNDKGCTNSAQTTVDVATPIKAEDVTISGADTLKVDATATYSATPANGTWTSSDTTIATIDKATGELKAIADGKVVLTYTVTNQAPCSGTVSAEKEVVVEKETLSSLAEIGFVSEVSLSPNPATSKVNVQFSLQMAATTTIEVIDIHGTIVNTVVIKNAVAGTNTTVINVSDFASGVYSVIVRSNDVSTTQKLVVAK